MKTLEEVILFQIDKTGKVAKQYSQRIFDQLNLGITIEQWILLKMLSERQPLSQKDLASKTFRDPSSITRTLDLLEKKNFLLRSHVPGNRRTYNIELSTEGQNFVNDNFGLIQEMREKSTSGFSKEEMKTLTNLLRRIETNMS